MESLLPDISILVEHAIDTLQERLLGALAKGPITEEIIRDICQDDDIISPFSDMETTYQHTQYFKAHLHMNVRDTYTFSALTRHCTVVSDYVYMYTGASGKGTESASNH